MKNIEIYVSKIFDDGHGFVCFCKNKEDMLYKLLTISGLNKFEIVNKNEHCLFTYDYADDLIKIL